MLLLEVLRTAVVPAAVVLCGALLARRLPEKWQPLGAAMGVALAFAVAHLWIAGFTPFPPIDATNAALWLAPLGLLPAALPVDRYGRTKVVLWGLLAGAVVWLVLWPLAAYYEWNAWSGTWVCGGTALVLVVLTRPCRGEVDSAAPAVLGITAAGAGVCAVLVHSAKLSQLSFALGVALAGISAVLWWRPAANPLARGAASVGAMALGALLLAIHHYAELAWWPLLLLTLAWASLELLPFVGHRLRPRTSLLVHTGIALIPIAAAIVVALVERLSQTEDLYY